MKHGYICPISIANQKSELEPLLLKMIKIAENAKIMLQISKTINNIFYKLILPINEELVMEEKNMIIALVLSLLWSGLGLIYAGDIQKGLALAIFAIVAELLYVFIHQIFGFVIFIIWVYSMYSTYKQVKAVNGQ